MSTHSSARRLLSPIEDLERLLSRRNRSEPSLLFNLEEDDMAGKAPPQGPIPELRSMEELLQAPTDGVGDAIVVPPILENQFELKIDTFYNSLNQSEQDSLNSAANGNFLTKNTQEALTIIKNKSKVQTSRNKPQVASASGSSTQDAHITSLTKQVEALLSLHRPVNYVQNGCETCGGPHAYYECQAAGGYTQEDVYATSGTYNQGGSASEQHHLNPREDLKAISTRSGVTLAGPSVPPPPSSSKEVEQEPETTMNQVLTEITTRVPPSVVQLSPASTSFEIPPAPVSSLVIPEPNPHQPLIPYPSRLNKKKLQDKADIQIHSFLQMFKKIYFNISFVEALAHMPKFAKMVKDLFSNKEKLLELANTPLNKNCSVVLLKKLPEKLEDTGRFLIPCEFYGLESCIALADLGDSINLMPLSMWKTLSLLELTPTRMTLELATWTVAYPAVDYDVDPPVPRILGRPFLRTAHTLVDVHGEELTLRVGDENLVFNVESTSKYPLKRGDESIHKIDILDITCEDHFHEETDAFFSLDDSIPPGIDNGIYDSDGDILFLEELLNDDPTPNLLPPLPVFEINETKKIKTSIDDPPDLKLKDLPPRLEYAFLEGTSKLPVIIANDLKREEKE
ncbi:hypothetical protein Tco_0597631 [Tanacetum coccineum]